MPGYLDNGQVYVDGQPAGKSFGAMLDTGAAQAVGGSDIAQAMASKIPGAVSIKDERGYNVWTCASDCLPAQVHR